MEDANVAIVRRVVDVFNSGDLAVFDELIAADYVNHDAPPGAVQGREGRKQVVAMFRGAFPDLRSTVLDVVADRDKVVVRANMQGTQNGTFMGRPPSGRAVSVTAIDIYRISDGQIAERWGVMDMLALMRQIDTDHGPG